MLSTEIHKTIFLTFVFLAKYMIVFSNGKYKYYLKISSYFYTFLFCCKYLFHLANIEHLYKNMWFSLKVFFL